MKSSGDIIVEGFVDRLPTFNVDRSKVRTRIIRCTAFFLATLGAYTMFVLFPEAIYDVYIFRSGSRTVNLWVIFGLMFVPTLRLALYLTIAVRVFPILRRYADWISSKAVPPYAADGVDVVEDPVRTREDIQNSINTSKKLAAEAAGISAVLCLILLYIYNDFLQWNPSILADYVGRIPNESAVTFLTYLMAVPLETISSPSVPLFVFPPSVEIADLFVTARVIFIWIPLLPLSIMILNTHNWLYRGAELILFDVSETS